MADVVVVERKHHSGLNADRLGVIGVLGDTYGASDSGKFYYWNANLNAWKTGLGYEFVERLANAIDFDKTAFTCDGALHLDGLDLSAIVPVGAIAVRIRLMVLDDAAGSVVTLRRDAGSGQNVIEVRPSVANIFEKRVEDISIDSDRLLDYVCANTVYNNIDLTVLGWFI